MSKPVGWKAEALWFKVTLLFVAPVAIIRTVQGICEIILLISRRKSRTLKDDILDDTGNI